MYKTKSLPLISLLFLSNTISLLTCNGNEERNNDFSPALLITRLKVSAHFLFKRVPKDRKIKKTLSLHILLCLKDYTQYTGMTYKKSSYEVLWKVYLEVVGRCPGADGQRDLVVEQMNDQVQVDRLLPVNVWIPDREFPAVPPPNIRTSNSDPYYRTSSFHSTSYHNDHCGLGTKIPPVPARKLIWKLLLYCQA